MKQIARNFRREWNSDKPVELQLNEYLAEHPSYTVDKINYSHPDPKVISEYLIVIFNTNLDN